MEATMSITVHDRRIDGVHHATGAVRTKRITDLQIVTDKKDFTLSIGKNSEHTVIGLP
jgi:hypothetical protein